MGFSKDVDIFTLYPTDPHLRDMLLQRLYSKTTYILTLSVIFASMATLLNIIMALGNGTLTSREGFLPTIADCARTAYYLFMFVVNWFYPKVGFVGAWSIPLVFTISITECYIICGFPEHIYNRYRFAGSLKRNRFEIL